MKLLIYGSKEFAQTVAELADDCGHEVAGFIDDFSTGPGILGTLTEVQRSHPPADFGIALAVGYAQLDARWDAWQRLLAAGYAAPALVHPHAYVAKSARIGAGAMLMAGALIDVRAQVGDIAVVWPGACVSHDSFIGNNCFISPNATVCGYVELGANSFVGAGAAIVDHCKVPSGTRIKMLSRYVRMSA
jgi:sugar O-acyltransferase (sialic acid O-acetyltransferase NeuD family)